MEGNALEDILPESILWQRCAVKGLQLVAFRRLEGQERRGSLPRGIAGMATTDLESSREWTQHMQGQVVAASGSATMGGIWVAFTATRMTATMPMATTTAKTDIACELTWRVVTPKVVL